jgi:hypothetical protein
VTPDGSAAKILIKASTLMPSGKGSSPSARRSRRSSGSSGRNGAAEPRPRSRPNAPATSGERVGGSLDGWDPGRRGGELASRFLRHRRRVVPSPCTGTGCSIIEELLKLSDKGAPPLPHSERISSTHPETVHHPCARTRCGSSARLSPASYPRQVVFGKLVQVPVSDHAYLRITDHGRSATALRCRRVDRKRDEAAADSSMSRSRAHGQSVYSFSDAARDPSERSYHPQVPGAPLKGPTMFGVIQPP